MSSQAPLSTYPATLSLKEALGLYLSTNGFRTEDYCAATFTIKLFGVPVKFPNTPGRQRIIPLHDLHHVLTGFETNWIGEAEVGAWELRAGCPNFEAYFLNGGGVIVGLFISPRRVWRSFRKARGHHTLYRESIPYDRLLQMTVGEARTLLGIPQRGIVSF